MKILLALWILAIATIALPAASPYTLEAPPGQHTNTIKSTPRITVATNSFSGSVSHGGTVTLEINPEATAALAALDRQGAIATPPPATVPQAAEPAGGLPWSGSFYADAFASLTTPNFKESDFGYGIGLGYQITKAFAADIRLAHDGLNIEDNAVSAIGGRVIARLPWTFLSPYGYLGASFDLRPDEWRLQPGAGIEFGVNKRLKGLSVFGEAGLDADLKGRNGYQFVGGLRWRF